METELVALNAPLESTIAILEPLKVHNVSTAAQETTPKRVGRPVLNALAVGLAPAAPLLALNALRGRLLLLEKFVNSAVLVISPYPGHPLAPPVLRGRQRASGHPRV